MYGMVLYVTVFYCIVLRYTLMCQNDYPLGLGSLKPNPSACHYRDQAMLQVLTIIFLFIVRLYAGILYIMEVPAYSLIPDLELSSFH